ncbi:hypothetical protein AAFC00_005119 [Neodothiora populina]|uniref:Sphingoid long-chain base transporter RSB1 n=1 Tax=Neodothiora populina TaxID=2781224 RepID=A0ABR3PJV1_9PEZI
MPQFCTEVSPQCPVEDTTYGYAPNLGGNIFFCVVFGICALAQLCMGIKYKLRAFTFAVTLGCAGECIGYAGRLIMHYNAWSSTGFKIQIVCLILCPSFLAAGIYLTLKHLVLHYGPEYSKLRPNLYTWIFIGCDILSILTQAAGGGIASAETADLVDIGDDVMVAGICIQVATMFVCAVLALDFALRVRRNKDRPDQTYHEPTTSGPVAFKFFVGAMMLAFLTIFIRSVYRIPEMVGGWGNPLMQDETEFLVLDGMMVAIAAICMTVAYPGIFFPEISTRYTKSKALSRELEEEIALGHEAKHDSSS